MARLPFSMEGSTQIDIASCQACTSNYDMPRGGALRGHVSQPLGWSNR